MSSHPTLTTAVYILIVVVFCSAIAYMFLYNRRVKSSKTDFINKGEMAASNDKSADSTRGSSDRPGSTS